MPRTKRKNTSVGPSRPSKKRRRGGKAQHTAKLTLSERTARHCRQFDPACEHLLKLDRKTLKLQLRKKKATLKKSRGELVQLQGPRRTWRRRGQGGPRCERKRPFKKEMLRLH